MYVRLLPEVIEMVESPQTVINPDTVWFDSACRVPSKFRLLPKVGNDNKQNEYYLPDVINLIIAENGKVAIDKISNYVEIQGVNNLEQLHDVNELYEKTC